VGTRYMKYPVD